MITPFPGINFLVMEPAPQPLYATLSMMEPMVWRRGKRPKDEAAMPPSLPPPGSDELEILPVLQEEGATKDREAYKRLKRAEADLKRMQKREKRAQKKEELRLRAIDRRIAKIERSRRIGPVRLIVNLVVFNGVAAVFAMLLLWWPDRPLYDPVLVTASVHWEVIIICFVGAAGTSIYLLAQNPSPQHVFKAQFVLGVYFALGLISMFSGILLAHVMEGMEALAVDCSTLWRARPHRSPFCTIPPTWGPLGIF
jgi:hypothetical protein